ncbi:MAG: hypothetical protein FWE06_00145 [Oscillospiraceae bacterium]|nr:hypothetical protein [Oscillospiraceae bacterium]
MMKSKHFQLSETPKGKFIEFLKYVVHIKNDEKVEWDYDESRVVETKHPNMWVADESNVPVEEYFRRAGHEFSFEGKNPLRIRLDGALIDVTDFFKIDPLTALMHGTLEDIQKVIALAGEGNDAWPPHQVGNLHLFKHWFTNRGCVVEHFSDEFPLYILVNGTLFLMSEFERIHDRLYGREEQFNAMLTVIPKEYKPLGGRYTGMDLIQRINSLNMPDYVEVEVYSEEELQELTENAKIWVGEDYIVEANDIPAEVAHLEGTAVTDALMAQQLVDGTYIATPTLDDLTRAIVELTKSSAGEMPALTKLKTHLEEML